MNSLKAGGSRSIILVRLIVGVVFLVEGIQKFLFPELLGVGRFVKIGVPVPGLTAPFVGGVEIIFGLAICLGLLTRLSAIPLLIDIICAIYFTKIPMLFEKGFWPTVHEARVDYCMLVGLVFLILQGGGRLSLDRFLSKK